MYLQSMVKISAKFQKKKETVGGVAHTRYPLSIHFHCQNARKITKFKWRKNVNVPYAHFQSMVKTSVKFQRNRDKTVGGVAHTRYILVSGGRKDGRTDGRTDIRTRGRTESRNYVPPLFFEKAGANNL